MKSKLFIIEVRLFGEWKPLSETEYAEADKREMADMQSQINALQLQAATANVLRFPNAWTFNGGVFPPAAAAA